MRNNVIIDAATGEVKLVPFTEEEEIAFENARIEREWSSLREHRNMVLATTDSMVLPDRWERLSPEKKKEWSDYRQALRDLPLNTEDPRQIVWPTKPE